MALRPITPWEPVEELAADEFRRDGSYTNWRPQGTTDWLLIYTAAGSGRVVTTCGETTTRAGDAILYRPQEMHDYRTAIAPGHWHLIWAHFHPRAHWHPWLRWSASAQGMRLLHLDAGEVRERFTAAMRRMILAARRNHAGNLDLAVNALEEALLWGNVARAQDGRQVMDERVRKAIDYLVQHARAPFELSVLARHCGLSISRLALLFKKETGISPQQFLEKQRLQQASQLLRLTSLTVAEIATEVGYSDPFYFSNRFHRFSQLSPTAYRVSRRDGSA